ncbi:EAL domain-containing protein [Noviherbaspirillum sp. CPCC 100848]|uniref:histidine kinase n=1 Tax=Noviherbaspirillum album TaxID=3080276 RepID=A0ABU6J5W3_9BURK|nr:EAL domain-containing protein [Noviherbaspirillum sp. CPCC 100848]MEC4719047.1 EAL domain-containing protein [Noviherbaspirillum sp. CPCC 100848]
MRLILFFLPSMFRNYLSRTGFRRQLTVVVSAAILGLALFSSLMNSWEASRRMEDYMVEQGQRIAENLARQSILALLYRSPDNVREGIATTLAFPDVLRVEITDTAGASLHAQSKPGVTVETVAAQQAQGLRAPSTRAVLAGDTSGEWHFSAPVYGGQSDSSPFEMQEREPQLLGHVHVVVGKGTHNRLVASLLVGNLAITLSFAAVLLGIMRLLARHMIRPLNALSKLMGRAESGESGMRAVPGGPRDIVEMAHAFNKMMDVLEEREAELKQSRDEAVRTALGKTQFAATVSHEVRTPLNGVVGMLDMLKEMRLPKRQQECVDIAWNSARSLVELINDILDFSKMEAGKLELEAIDFDLRKVIEEVIELLAKQAQQKGLEIGYLMAPGVPERIRGDSLRMRQVLLNLIGNAVKFTEHGEVSVRILAAPDREEHFGLRFEVIDTGIGMNADAVKHIFESFAQADRSTTRKYGGTGLGLAICRQLVDLMQGDIGVSSEPGKGSTFWFTVRCAAAATQPPAREYPGLQGMRVLVIDSSLIVRSFITQSLEAAGMRCNTVLNGPEAMSELARAEQARAPYALVVMDAEVTDDRGTDLVRRLRIEIGAVVPRMLVLDRYATPMGNSALGADLYLGKPLRLERLMDAVQRLLPQAPAVTSAPLQTAPALAVAAKDYRVLVAEDNRTNQMVAGGMLSMNGCECQFAANGREAVEAARTGRFDLILMDCSMPEMDGYEATAHIRNFEETLGLRTPIIAMTANTQPGDADKCLAAGMDDYLAKPITLAEVRQKLERWLSRLEPSGRAMLPEVETGDGDGSPINDEVFEKLREILGPALQQTVTPFLEDTPAYLDQLEQAVRDGNADGARAMAHSIKGSSGNLGAIALAQLAKEAEELAIDRRLDAIKPLVSRLRSAFDAVSAVLGVEGMITERHSARDAEDLPLVLVVDDDRSTRSSLRHTLQRDGFRIEEAADGAQALHMLKRIQPDVILMDAVMPVMDGFTACARVRELPNGNAIPVLMITALEDNNSVERAFAAGASDYIPKPIHFAVLSQRVRRIIEANQAEKRIRHLAYNDLLTGLPNRALFMDQLGRRIEQARVAGEAVAVLFLDLDRFKNVNDSLGHDVGDRLLIAVAQRLRRSVRNADCVARLGGDEFTVVLAEVIGPNAAVSAAQNICRALSTPFQIDGHDIFVSTSVGISMYPHDATDVGTLLKHADTAMYRAKKTGSGFQFFEASMEHSISEHVRMENDLRRALERNELEVYYQPQARVNSGRIVGAEALVRWRHPTRGMVSPAEFIPLAEETGLINPLGEWVLRTACRQLQAWTEAGLPPIRVAVNLSVKQLLKKDFAASVEQALNDTFVHPSMLELEITESTLMENAQDTLEALHRLRDLGVRLSIDDFGTGYSSLSYLKRFPVDIIKIDRSFVRDVPHDADDAAIVTGIIALAHSLRLEVVAEGVETASQLEFLQERSCDMMQGYYLSKPVPAEQFAREMLATESPRWQSASPTLPGF